MSNVQWRKIYMYANEIIDEFQMEELTEEFKSELERIKSLINSENEVESYQKIANEAPQINFSTMSRTVEEKYNNLISKAKRLS